MAVGSCRLFVLKVVGVLPVADGSYRAFIVETLPMTYDGLWAFPSVCSEHADLSITGGSCCFDAKTSHRPEY